MAYPIFPRLPRKLPSSTGSFVNGSPPASLLRDPGDRRGPLLVPCSYGMQALHIHARSRGFLIQTTGRGRSIARQTQMVLERMLPYYNSDRCQTTGSRTMILDQREIHPDLRPGHKWYLLKGQSPVATPSTSNHGWYCADDLSEENDGDAATDPISEALCRFLVPIAHEFGWTWEMQSEPWHVTWMGGDEIPDRAKQVLRAAGIDYPGSTPTPPEDDDMLEILDKPYRSYDSRNQGGPLLPGQQRRVPVGLCDIADIVIGSVGHGGSGFLYVNGAEGTSAVGFMPFNPIDRTGIPVSTPDGHIMVGCVGDGPCDFTIDVYAVG